MDNYRQQFENELRAKLQQKSTSHVSEETVLLRAFKYFDLDNSETVSLDEWTKAIEKIGLVVPNQRMLEDLFRFYDTDHSGALDYKEFVAAIFNNQSITGRPGTSQKTLNQLVQDGQAGIEKIRERLAARGGRGIMGLARQFKIMDDDGSGYLDFYEFSKAIRDFRVDIRENELQAVFNLIDRDRSGEIDYDEFLRAVRGPMNDFRIALVNRAFDKLDSDHSGILDIEDIKGFYNARGHPDVRSGRKTEDDVLGEFLETFEMHHNIGGTRDRKVTREEFLEYYNNISASVDNDQYFELMMSNTWKLNEAPAYTKNKAWANEDGNKGFSKPAKNSPGLLPPAPPLNQRSVEMLLERFRNKLATRGARGIIGIARQFKIMDDDNSGTISLGEFRKGCRDFRIDIEDEDIEKLFNALDRDRSGIIDYDELIRGIRGPMNSFRRGVVGQAWNKLDRDKSGVIDIEDLKGVYSAKNHPDVRAGKKTENEVLGEFLETFETHHNISDLSKRDRNITREEFEEYYNNVSASIDDDRYFELMMNNAWKLQQDSGRGAYAGSSKGFSPDSKRAYLLANHPSAALGKSVASTAPYGTSETYGVPRRDVDVTESQPRSANPTIDEILENLRSRLAARGARGFVGIARNFKIIDDDGSGNLDYNEFLKAMRDFRVDFEEKDLRKLFNHFDADNSGTIDYEEFIHRLRGPMNNGRKQLVTQAFNKLDSNGNGIVEIDDIKGVYNARSHPDVRAGKKTEEDILCEFLDTFETHHATFKENTRDHRVTLEEFMEYYAHVSASIDDDRYFELMMRNSWNFDGKSYEKGWAGDNTTPARRQR
ncbi:unnamed protein product [Blepharisma stoltei]|uniref:EF-hand domain-containing protein n=1 Tax=Blepharisma stoltei TaxID=1481888 RepID=A0AAU9ITV2_9CILI|nr:unnamed protein product [Blepharisma stoltei]